MDAVRPIEPDGKAALRGWDCHVHVFGPPGRYAMAEPRAYTPTPAGVAALRLHLLEAGVAQAVLIQPSPYGVDDSCLLDALAELGAGFRAVVAAEGQAGWQPDARLRGVRGWRFNPMGRLGHPETALINQVAMLAHSAASRGMSLEIGLSPATVADWAPHLARLPGPLVLSHFGGALHPAHGEVALDTLARLLEPGRLWLKLSGADRWPAALGTERLEQVVRRFAALAPERLVWGSDWPNTPLHDGRPATGDGLLPHRHVDSAALLARIADALGGAAQRVLVDNPLTLYD